MSDTNKVEELEKRISRMEERDKIRDLEERVAALEKRPTTTVDWGKLPADEGPDPVEEAIKKELEKQREQKPDDQGGAANPKP